MLLLAAAPTIAQRAEHLPAQFLVALNEQVELADLVRGYDAEASVEKVSDLLNIWLLHSQKPEETVLTWLRQHPQVRAAQYNHVLENRVSPPNILPNDPFLGNQWHLINTGADGGLPNADLDAELAWDITTGGLTPAGDTIVVAVIDGGIQATHPDLQANMWKNWAEIPNNGLDDDQNGYADDFLGWNTFTQTDHITGSSSLHGTPVSAVLGASGNNGQGVAGVNWVTKMMFVAADGVESDILAAFDYVGKARQRYQASNGQRGAFVVAVNCSWGLNFGQASEAPLWCMAYDALGALGILSVAATANLPVNVDLVGDLPTTCPSPYLIAVTSLNKSDVLAPNAAWGSTHVDLAAYGQGVFSAASASGYGLFSGTSFATPQVTGAVGLLYSAPCPSLIALAKTAPELAALWAKSLILETVSPNTTLQGITGTSGRLNIAQALQQYQNQCSICPPPFALQADILTDTSAILRWVLAPNMASVSLRWRKMGTSTWEYMPNLHTTFYLWGLERCAEYEFEVQGICNNTDLSTWSPTMLFRSLGCCMSPSQIGLVAKSETSASLVWNRSSNMNQYRLRLQEIDGPNAQIIETDTAYIKLNDLEPCTEYRLRIQSICEDSVTNFSDHFVFKTLGCGACTELVYCSAKAEAPAQAWIAGIQMGAWEHISGAGGSGYQDFTQQVLSTPVLFAGSSVPVWVTPGFSGFISKEYFRIFIDFNQDGDFSGADELVFDPGFALEGVAEGILQVPSSLIPGVARMRVMMKYTTPNDSPPMPCEQFSFGQVEDYCVLLQADSAVSVSALLADAPWSIQVYPQPAQDWVVVTWPQESETDNLQWFVWNSAGQIVAQASASQAPTATLRISTAEWPSGLYVLRMRCGNRWGSGKVVKR